jgi:hypothetical protein
MCKCGLNPSDKERGTNPPKASIVTGSVALRFDLLVNGPYITSNSSVWLSPNRQLLKILPVDLPIRAGKTAADPQRDFLRHSLPLITICQQYFPRLSGDLSPPVDFLNLNRATQYAAQREVLHAVSSTLEV